MCQKILTLLEVYHLTILLIDLQGPCSHGKPGQISQKGMKYVEGNLTC